MTRYSLQVDGSGSGLPSNLLQGAIRSTFLIKSLTSLTSDGIACPSTALLERMTAVARSSTICARHDEAPCDHPATMFVSSCVYEENALMQHTHTNQESFLELFASLSRCGYVVEYVLLVAMSVHGVVKLLKFFPSDL